MGVSHSIVGQSVPVELALKILLYLSIADLTSCRCVNHALHDIIDDSLYLQHQIDMAIAGVVDNHHMNMSLPERRRVLKLREEAWDNLKPQYTNTSKLAPFFPDLIQDSVYFIYRHPPHPFVLNRSVGYCFPSHPTQGFGQSWSHLYPLPRQFDCEITALAVCLEENDLVAMGVWYWNGSKSHSNYYTHSLEVDLLSFSSRGDEHPAARESTLFFGDVSVCEKVAMEIRAGHLIVFLEERRDLLVFDWKTGQNVAQLTDKAINAFRFLSDEVIVVANNDEFGASLDLFTLPKPQGDAIPTPMMKVAKLCLPKADQSIYRLVFCNPPAKNGTPRSNRPLDNAAVSIKPFTNPPGNNIIRCWFLGDGSEHFSAIVHSSTLLRYATPQHFKSIPWDEWNSYARCILDQAGSMATDFSGQRFLKGNEIWDFNQYRVKRLGKDFATETKTAHISVVTEISRVGVIDCKNPIYSSLPYVRIVPKLWEIACLDDDRMFTAPSTPSRNVQQLYFG